MQHGVFLLSLLHRTYGATAACNGAALLVAGPRSSAWQFRQLHQAAAGSSGMKQLGGAQLHPLSLLRPNIGATAALQCCNGAAAGPSGSAAHVCRLHKAAAGSSGVKRLWWGTAIPALTLHHNNEAAAASGVNAVGCGTAIPALTTML
jgi:hypothetical protein